MNWKLLLGISFACLLVIAQIVYWADPFLFKDSTFSQEALFSCIDTHFFLTIGLYILFFISTVLFGIPLSITVAGGYLFGVFWGTIASMIGALIGATILCNITRFVLRDWVEKRYHKEIKPFNKQLERYGIWYLIAIQMVPFMPSLLPNAVSSLSSLPIARIILANAIGALPPTMVYSYLGAYVHHVDSLSSFLWLVVIILSLAGISLFSVLLYTVYLRK